MNTDEMGNPRKTHLLVCAIAVQDICEEIGQKVNEIISPLEISDCKTPSVPMNFHACNIGKVIFCCILLITLLFSTGKKTRNIHFNEEIHISEENSFQ